MDNSPVNDIIVGGLDQVLPMEKAQKDILQRVDSIIQQSVEEGNPDIAANALKSILGVSRMGGLASAKFIYTFQFNWKNFPQSKHQKFEEYVMDELGIGKTTIKRYFRVWEMLVSGDIPREYCEKLKLHPIKSLIPMATLWAGDFEISNQNWLSLSNAPDVATVNKIIRDDIKHKPPKKGSMQLELGIDGTIYAWKNSKRYYVGYLKVDDTDPVVQAAIVRIMGDGKIMEIE